MNVGERRSASKTGKDCAVQAGRPRAPAPHALPFFWAGRTAAIAASRGVPILDILSDAGVGEINDGINDNTVLSLAQYTLMNVAIINLVDDEMHAISRVRMPRGTHSTGLKIMASARSFQAAIESFAKFYDLMGRAEKITLVRTEQTARVEIVADIADRRTAAVVEEMAAIALHCQFSFILDRPLSLLSLVASGDHPHCNATHPYLGCRVVRGASTALVFPAAYLDLEPKAKIDDAPVTRAVMSWLEHIDGQKRVGLNRNSLKPLSAGVFNHLIDRDMSYEECCREMGMHGDDLRRALFAEGSGFRLLRQNALLERVRPHLLSGATMDDIAAAVGLSDARSLRRSIQSVSGMSLTELKRSASRNDNNHDPLVMTRLRYYLDAMD